MPLQSNHGSAQGMLFAGPQVQAQLASDRAAESKMVVDLQHVVDEQSRLIRQLSNQVAPATEGGQQGGGSLISHAEFAQHSRSRAHEILRVARPPTSEVGLQMLAEAATETADDRMMHAPCANCATTTSPKWRYADTLCNACGLRRHRAGRKMVLS